MNYTIENIAFRCHSCNKIIKPYSGYTDKNERLDSVMKREFYDKGWTTHVIRTGHDYISYCENCSTIKDILE